MRTMNIEVEAEVTMTVKVKLELVVKADEGIDLDRTLSKFSKGKGGIHVDGADFEDVTVMTVHTDGLAEELQEKLEEGLGFEVLDYNVTNSR